MANATYDEPHGMSQSKKAAASGWIGSALEYTTSSSTRRRHL